MRAFRGILGPRSCDGGPKMGRAVALLGAALLACAAAPCGSVVIPNGIGLGAPAAPGGLNPLLAADGQTLQVILLLYRPLVWIGQDIGFDRDRSLAASVEGHDAGARFRVTLKPWQWSDGVPVTADDVLFGWGLIQALGADFYPFYGQGGIPDRVQDVRAAGPSAVDFVMKAPTNQEWFTLNGLSLIYALPRHAWGKIGTAELRHRQFDASLYQVTDGPFRLAELRPDRYIAFAPNPLYGGHVPSLRRLVVIFPEPEAGLNLVRSGEADMARVSYPIWSHLQGMRGFRFVALPEPYGYASLALNFQSMQAPFLRDARVRRALAYAADQPGMIKSVFGGLGTENYMPAPTVAAWRRRAAAGDVAEAIHFDPAKARAELDSDGWVPGADGVRRKQAERLAFTAIVNDADSEPTRTLQILQQNFRAVGVAMSLRIMPFAQMTALTFGGGRDWDAAIMDVTQAGLPDGLTYFDTGGAANWGRYSDPEMDRRVRDIVARPGHDALFDFQAYAESQQPAIFLPQGKQLMMIADRVGGVEDFVNEVGFWSPEYLSVDDPSCRIAAPDRALR